MTFIQKLKSDFQNNGIVHQLILIHAFCFILSMFFYDFKASVFEFSDWVYLSSTKNQVLLKPWTLLSYAFLHENIWGLLINMLFLRFSGQLFLTFFSKKQFLAVYIGSIIFCGILFVVAYTFLNKTGFLIGISGAVMALLAATTVFRPQMNVSLLFIGNIKLWYITALFLLIDIMQLQSDNSGGRLAHLAGATFGFLYIKLLQNGFDLAHVFVFKKKTTFKKVHKNYQQKPQKTASKIILKDKTQQQIDEILDKISKSGYDSLDKTEKDFLFKARN
jgi:membrane associated rhomboid family serine protease